MDKSLIIMIVIGLSCNKSFATFRIEKVMAGFLLSLIIICRIYLTHSYLSSN